MLRTGAAPGYCVGLMIPAILAGLALHTTGAAYCRCCTPQVLWRRCMGDQRLRPGERLRCASAYRRVFEQGEKLVGSFFILYILPTSEPRSRLGMAVSKRMGNAVVRNRIKRCLRETFRQHKALLPSACDVVCVARHGAVGVPCARYSEQFLLLLQCCQRLRR